MKAIPVPIGVPKKSEKSRIEYWGELPEVPIPEIPQSNWRVKRAVRWALRKLSYMEREAVERFYYCDQSYADVGTVFGISENRVYTVIKQARRKLRRLLGPFVQKRYGIPTESGRCQVCLSPHREAIEGLLETKSKEETWKRILQKLRTEFQIRTSAWSLVRHRESHRSMARSKAGSRPAEKGCGASTV